MNEQQTNKASKLWNPYAAGFFLGIVLLASFLIMGQGLGASGGVARVAIKAMDTVAHDAVAANGHFGSYVENGNEPLMNYMVFLGLGVVLGGFIGAMSSGRFKVQLEKGPRATTKGRIIGALAGGAIMGFAARLAYGCTSGQALTGGAMLAAGSWAFMGAVFVGGYALAWFVRRMWI